MFRVGDRVRVVNTQAGENDWIDHELIGREGCVVSLTRKGERDNAELPIGVELDDDGGETYFAPDELELIPTYDDSTRQPQT